MSRSPARCTQADLARAIRASQQANAGDVVLQPDGTILIRVLPSEVKTEQPATIVLDDEAVIPL